MNFFEKITNYLESSKIINYLANTKNHTPDDYLDLQEGLPWFAEYRRKGSPTLSEFFGLEKANRIKIKATIGKTGFYQTSEGKRWAVVAHYFDNDKQKECTFYCPEWTYDPIDEYRAGDKLNMYVDKSDYTKYEMPIY
jgi:Pyruvate/2-oxoacid:ferredoxin oxidoreductase delta subunit